MRKRSCERHTEEPTEGMECNIVLFATSHTLVPCVSAFTSKCCDVKKYAKYTRLVVAVIDVISAPSATERILIAGS